MHAVGGRKVLRPFRSFLGAVVILVHVSARGLRPTLGKQSRHVEEESMAPAADQPAEGLLMPALGKQSRHVEESIAPAAGRPADSLLVTTAYWNVRSKRGNASASDVHYVKRMSTVMNLNCPLLIYGNAHGLQELRGARAPALPALVASVEVNISELSPCSSYPEIFAQPEEYTNGFDVPSVELGCIWDGKWSLLARSAAEHHEYHWHAWLDVGMHSSKAFHPDSSWPNREKLRQFPTDKVIVSSSGQDRCEDCRDSWTYCHCIAATAFVVHRAIVKEVAELFVRKFHDCMDAPREPLLLEGMHDSGFVCLSEQVIMTKMFLERPDLFHFTEVGYGAVAYSDLS